MKFTRSVIAALAIGTSFAAFADGVEWSGFGSLYYSQAFDNQFLLGQHSNNKPDYTTHSLVGFNVGSKLGDNMSFSSQIVMAGAGAQSTNYNMFAQFAYLTYNPVPSVSLKIGRQLWPMLISSEYQRVHFLLPQTEIPATVYGLMPFVAFDGVSANKSLDTAIGSLTLGAYAGAPKLNRTPPAGLAFDFPSIIGARATLDGSGWRLHATANQFKSKMTISYLTSLPSTKYTSINEATSTIYSFGYRYDKYNIVSWGEMFTLKSTDNSLVPQAAGGPQTNKYFQRSYGGYVLAGYRFGKYLPTLTYAQGTAKLGFPTDPTTNQKYDGKVTSYIFCNSFQMNDQASFKVEFQRSYVPSAGGGYFDVAQSTTSTKKYGDMLKAGIDFIF